MFDKAQVKLTLKSIKAGRKLLADLDQAQLFWTHAEAADLMRVLEEGESLSEANLEVLRQIKERVWYFLTDKLPAYEPILRRGSTKGHPLVDPSLEHARVLWESLRTFRQAHLAASDHRKVVNETITVI